MLSENYKRTLCIFFALSFKTDRLYNFKRKYKLPSWFQEELANMNRRITVESDLVKQK